MNEFAHHLQNVEIGDPLLSGNLAVFPLFRDFAGPFGSASGPGSAGYLSLDAALADGKVAVDELDSASVPTLRLHNQSDTHVLLLDGEQLIGAMQNRTVNVTLLVGAGTTTEIPVSCVEAGRWSRTSHRFRTSRHMHYARGRREKMRQVNASLRRDGSRAADQSRVWDDIEDRRRAFGAMAETSAMEDVYLSAERGIRGYERDLEPLPEQVGAVFAINGEVHGFDLFSRAEHCAAYFPKLLRSHALDAMEAARASSVVEVPTREAVSAFLKQFEDAATEVHDAVGLGQDVRAESHRVVGAGLVHEDDCVHMAGFAKERVEELV